MLNTSQTRRLPLVGAAGVASFFVASMIAGALNPGYSPAREAISALAATDARHAWVMIVGFMLCAVGIASTGVALWRRFAGNRAARAAAGIMIFVAPLMVVSGFARQDCSERLKSCVDYGEGTGASAHFWVHQYVGMLLFVLLTAALFLLARGLRRDVGLSQFAVPTRVAGLLCVLFIADMIIEEMHSIDSYAGLAQRAFGLVLFGWPVVIAMAGARSVPRGIDSLDVERGRPVRA